MKILAVEQQQCLYELLPDYIMYKSDEYKYLKQNIGYALFGPPEGTKNTNATEKNSICYYKTENDTDSNDTEVTDTVDYDEKAKIIIDKIYDKICTCVIETDGSQPSIYFGIIYNMIFRPKTNVKPKKKEEKKKEAETKVKKEDKENEKGVLLIVTSVPIFKIKKSIQKKSEATKSAKQEDATIADEIQYETWYIDSNARVYKSWTDYIENNHLPKCTMVLPKDGVYQPDMTYIPTEDYSTVWLEIMESSACKWKSKLLNGIDIASNVVGFGTIGLSVAALFTPLAPVVVVSGKLPFNI